MARESALHSVSSTGRMRVRTPGKHIILILFLPVSIVAAIAGLWLNFQERRALYASVEYRQSANGSREAYYALPEFLVDLRPDADGRTAYLRLQVSLQLEDHDIATSLQRVDAAKPMVIERLNFFLRELRPADFSGSERMSMVKNEMLRRVNMTVEPARAREVVIEEILIQ